MRVKLTDVGVTHATSGIAIHEVQIELPNGKILSVYTSAGEDNLPEGGAVVDIANSSGNFLATWTERSLRSDYEIEEIESKET